MLDVFRCTLNIRTFYIDFTIGILVFRKRISTVILFERMEHYSIARTLTVTLFFARRKRHQEKKTTENGGLQRGRASDPDEVKRN